MTKSNGWWLEANGHEEGRTASGPDAQESKKKGNISESVLPLDSALGPADHVI